MCICLPSTNYNSCFFVSRDHVLMGVLFVYSCTFSLFFDRVSRPHALPPFHVSLSPRPPMNQPPPPPPPTSTTTTITTTTISNELTTVPGVRAGPPAERPGVGGERLPEGEPRGPRPGRRRVRAQQPGSRPEGVCTCKILTSRVMTSHRMPCEW